MFLQSADKAYKALLASRVVRPTVTDTERNRRREKQQQDQLLAARMESARGPTQNLERELARMKKQAHEAKQRVRPLITDTWMGVL